MDREFYYKELLEYVIKEFYQIELDRSKNHESLMPNVRIDSFFEIPKWKLSKAKKKSPFPYFGEQNIVQIKAFKDPLSKAHFKQYLGQLYIKTHSERSKGKELVLLIMVSEEPSKSIYENSLHQPEKTNIAFIDKIKADYPAYLFVLERLPIEEKYWYFLPFLPLKVLKREKVKILEIAKKIKKKKEYKDFLLWLNKLQEDFYKAEIKEEVEVAIGDKKAVAIDFFPNATKEIENDGKEKQLKEDFLIVLKHRFKRISKQIKEKIDLISEKQDFHFLLKKALEIEDIKEFETELNKILKK